MTARQIKALIFNAGYNMSEAAAIVGCTAVEFSHMIYRRREYPEYRKALALLVNKPVSELFPSKKTNHKQRVAA